MATVFKKAEWPADVEADPEQLSAAVMWAVRGLVRMCEDISVAPIGSLLVVDKTLDETGLTRAYELQLELNVGPLIRPFVAAGARCPVLGCKTVSYGKDDAEAAAAALTHWERAHSAGDHFA